MVVPDQKHETNMPQRHLSFLPSLTETIGGHLELIIGQVEGRVKEKGQRRKTFHQLMK
jgi:hypothetical protein